MSKLAITLVSVLAWGCSVMGMARAEQTEARLLLIELNRIEPTKNGCRTTFLFANRLATDFENLTFELVLFDRNDQVVQFVTVATGELPRGKTKVRLFDLSGMACDQLKHILLNGVTRCGKSAAPEVRCPREIETKSRARIKLIQ